MNSVKILRLTGSNIIDYIDKLAELRITVFREFPYLYAGSLEYEKKYLQRYTRSENTVVVFALDGDEVVGASTGMPLDEEDQMVRIPFESRGLNTADFFYFGESVLLGKYRGRGIGVRFFEEREAHALSLGFTKTTFCAVDRPPDHPRRPENYTPLNNFWEKRGYTRHPDLKATFTWQDLDESAESPKTLTFWIKNH